MYSSIRSLLFRLEPERAHALTLNALRFAGNFLLTRKLLDSFTRPLQNLFMPLGLL